MKALAVIIVALLIVWATLSLGIGGFGPTRTWDVTVTRLYVDTGKDKSHYMVGTDRGVFEVANGFILGLWNADELYARLQVGHHYALTTRGKRVVNFMFQHYPYVVGVQEVLAK